MNFQRQVLETSHKEQVELVGGFRTNGGSAPTAFYGNWIQSIARDGAGLLTITMKPDFRNLRLYGMQVSLQLAAAGDSKAQFGAYDASAGTLVVRTITGTAAADIAADADNKVWITLTAKYGRANDGSPNYES